MTETVTAEATPTHPRLNLGCGDDHRDGWVNVDIAAAVEPDVVHDLDDIPWPWPDNSVTEIEARHVFEHLRDPQAAFAESARVLEPGGRLVWTYPIGHTRFEDTTHRWYWNWHSGPFQAGARGDHTHETPDHWRVADSEYQWHMSAPEPLALLYTKYRAWLHGPGPWLEQMPGVAGERTVVLEYQP